MKRLQGFTLIELLIVVAIIGILAAIAVPNFMNAQVRAKVARAESEMKSLQTALESFFIDNNGYPPMNSDRLTMRRQYRDLDSNDAAAADINIAHISIGTGSRARRIYLTTPIAYLGSLPFDPFHGDGTSHGYGYGSNGQAYYVLTSWGPDTADGLGSADEFNEFEYTGARFTDFRRAAFRDSDWFLSQFLYDSSNGITSDGDLIKVGP